MTSVARLDTLPCWCEVGSTSKLEVVRRDLRLERRAVHILGIPHLALPIHLGVWLEADAFADAGWEAPRVLAALVEAEDVYVDAVSQVMAPRWSHGRGALVSDAAYCPSPVSGMGANLALVGAYVLVGELLRHSNHRDAFVAYEKRMRPYVDLAQTLPPAVPWIAHPRTRWGITLFHTVLGLASSRLLRHRVSTFGSTSDKIVLPDYSNGG